MTTWHSWRTWEQWHQRLRRDERGDVPGWVMITVMTAGIVVALTLIAGPELSSMLRDALAKVH